MKIVELTNIQFDEFARYHALTNYCQTSKYGLIMTNYGYTYDYIGYVDESGTIKAASLILTKKIQGRVRYGYAPKGFLINYYDRDLLKNFLNDLRKYYKRQDFVLIKFNPEMQYATIDPKNNYQENFSGNVSVIDSLKNNHCLRRIELEEFQLLEPHITAFINLKNYNINSISRNFRKKIKKCENKGMRLITGEAKEMDILYSMLKGKTQKTIQYFRDFYNIYSKDNSIDLLFIQIDYQKYLTKATETYEAEVAKNDALNLAFLGGNAKVYSQKINSDKRLQSYKEDVIRATEGLKKYPSAIIAGALVIKHHNRITVFASGYKDEFRKLNPNHYLYHSIMERYKAYFDYCDLNGLSGKWTPESEYYGLNQFKINFNPTIIEYIGEFDLVCNEFRHAKLMRTSFIEDEFAKFH